MTKDDIIKMVKEAKMYAEYVTPQGLEWFDTYNERFASLVAEKEREACAKTAESLDDWANDPYETATIREIAALIRARGNSES